MRFPFNITRRHFREEYCEICGRPANNFANEEEYVNHISICRLEEIQRDAELLQISKNKECSICFQEVWQTKTKCFGLLDMCNHSFCWSCIYKWRQQMNSNGKKREDCPLCRVKSSVLFASRYWPGSRMMKFLAAREYAAGLKKIHCRQFAFGDGFCDKGSRCEFKHADLKDDHLWDLRFLFK